MIETVGLEKTYPDGTTALCGLDLCVDRAEMVLIRGPSGAGKTTLFRLLLGMERPTSGEVFIDDRRVDTTSVRQVRALRRGVGMIFQDFRLIRGRTARENVEIGMRVLGLSGREMRERATRYLEEVGLDHRVNTPAELLSWGEQQRVGVARALAREPQIILADEPTGNLDEDLSHRILQLLRGARDAGASVLVAIHSPDVLRQTELRVISLQNGRLVGDSRAVCRRGEGSWT